MEELTRKIEHLEKLKMEKEAKERVQEEEAQRRQEQRQEASKNFLGNIKSFNIDDDL